MKEELHAESLKLPVVRQRGFTQKNGEGIPSSGDTGASPVPPANDFSSDRDTEIASMVDLG